MYKTILFEQKDSVLTITLNRPDVYNAFNVEMLTELHDAFKKAGEDENVRCVILTGAGKAFCSGQDLKDFNEKKLTFKEALEQRYNPLIKSIVSLPKPVICAINGVAAGAGLSLALACDYRIAVENAALIEVFINVGLVPDSGSGFFLPRIIGYAKAFEMCATGGKLTAIEAKEYGLVNKLVSSNKLLMKSAMITAKSFAAKPTKAIGMIKDLLNKSFQSGLDEILELEGNYQQQAGNSEDFKEGIASFLEKRKSVFKGK
ncbi:MAG: enoyl-CoA hydratase/isomerase family protein [Ignavibacteria bacterium]|nr:enoyl-CoA hydratase/isomerase family protein [Ignavibacteria bacterium]